MEQTQAIKIPAEAIALVAQKNQAALVAQKELGIAIAVLRATLHVPDGWVLRDLEEGFINPKSIDTAA